MNQPVEQIVRRKLSDEVFDRLERMITSGELKPGDDMPSERVLMERFGVGRPAIREAMQSLANMGLVAISHGERAKVLELTAQSIFRQVDLTAKIMLSQSSELAGIPEKRAYLFRAGHGARGRAQKPRNGISKSCAKSSNGSGDRLGKAEEFISADMQFHTRIAQISGNPIFVAVSEAMLAWLKEYHTDMLIWTGKEKFTLAEHEKIVDRLAAADADGAEVAMSGAP